jgi:hypothetical protein
MRKLEREEMERVDGGINIFLVTAIAAAVVFVSGIITGIVKPTECNKG